ncbi:MAG: fructosamine kinase family protein [Microthrixaceae bacterium]
MTTAPVRSAIESALGDRVVAEVPLSGGDVATSMRVELASGATVFAKSHPDPPPGFFSTEAESLRWLRSSGSVNVPRVLAHGDDPPHLVLEWIDSGPTRPGTEARFGAQLAELHRTAPGSFGRPDSRTTGSRRLPNDPAGSWAEFYATRRLVPLAGLAREAGALPTSTISSSCR